MRATVYARLDKKTKNRVLCGARDNRCSGKIGWIESDPEVSLEKGYFTFGIGGWKRNPETGNWEPTNHYVKHQYARGDLPTNRIIDYQLTEDDQEIPGSSRELPFLPTIALCPRCRTPNRVTREMIEAEGMRLVNLNQHVR